MRSVIPGVGVNHTASKPRFKSRKSIKEFNLYNFEALYNMRDAPCYGPRYKCLQDTVVGVRNTEEVLYILQRMYVPCFRSKCPCIN